VSLVVLLPFVAAVFAAILALVSLLRKRPTFAAWCFFAGMLVLAASSLATGAAARATQVGGVARWLAVALVVQSFLPVIWLAFAVTYSRGDSGSFLRRWKAPLAFFALLPAFGMVLQGQLIWLAPSQGAERAWTLQFTTIGKALHAAILVGFVLILMNLEQTFRSAVGTMRWRIKFVVLALGVIFGTGIYTHSQAILFSAVDLAQLILDSTAILIGGACLALAYARTGLAEIDVYPSRAVLRSSLTILIVGAYLFLVGAVAQLVTRFGGQEIFQFQAVVLLVGITGLAVLLLSDRARQYIDAFTARHFRKAQHDSVRVWALFSRNLATVKDQADLSRVCARLVSETFEALSVTVWLVDEENQRLVPGASTAGAPGDGADNAEVVSTAVLIALEKYAAPFDLDAVKEPWAEAFRQANRATFPEPGTRLCVPLRAGERTLGAIVLADRVNSALYTPEEIDLLKCIGDQVASVLMNLRLVGEVARARELEAFRTMSTFFVHDLKNAASSLHLMLRNLPVHFNDPEFREDALRGIGTLARRIEDIIARLSDLRKRPSFTPVESNLNELVGDVLQRVNGTPNVEIVQRLQPLPAILVDPEQVRSVVTNLVLNARDAVGPGGRIEVRTEHRDGRVVLSVADNGCGMSPAFIKDSLFRPFQSTKKQGLGIGLFQSRAIVRAHGGGIHVESEPGKGTTFHVSFPVKADHDQTYAPDRR
jgi:putative PEP-CTERM system histidine kinase